MLLTNPYILGYQSILTSLDVDGQSSLAVYVGVLQMCESALYPNDCVEAHPSICVYDCIRNVYSTSV